MSNNPTIIEELVKHIEEHGLCVIKTSSRTMDGYRTWKKLESFYRLIGQELDYDIIPLSTYHMSVSIRFIYKPSCFIISPLPDLQTLNQCLATVKKAAINHPFIFVIPDSEYIIYE